MQRTNPDLDIIADVIKAVLAVKPDAVFIKSIQKQYIERGSLSKKQLEGLHSSALKVTCIHPGKLATLEAIILKKPTRYRSELPAIKINPLPEDPSNEFIEKILLKYPQHKRVLFFKAKKDNHEMLSVAEKAELHKFVVLLKVN